MLNTKNLADVHALGMTTGQVLTWNSTLNKWTNGAGGGVQNLSQCGDVMFASLTTGDTLVWNGADWVNVGLNATIQQVVNAYALAWKSAWNVDVNSLIASASITWNQITGANSTVAALIAASSINFNQLIGVPNIGGYSFLIQVNDPVVGNYSARYPNGSIYLKLKDERG